MLGESPEQIEARERRVTRVWLLHFASTPSLIRWRPDVAWRLLDKLLDGAEPQPQRWANPWRELDRLAWWYWKAWTALKRAEAT